MWCVWTWRDTVGIERQPLCPGCHFPGMLLHSNMAGDSHIGCVYCGARGGVADKQLSDLLCLGTR